MPDTDYGALAAALAKAQSSFPAIPRDKEVTVTMDKGGSYKFKYAPLDSILTATRPALSANGLAVAQLLDSDADGAPALVTMLLHSGGASLTARTPIPFAEGAKVQAFGSAITYLRRYALQAMLGIAAEEDDDGNRASGNTATLSPRPAPAHLEPGPNGSLIGFVQAGDKTTSDYLIRMDPDGTAHLGFRLLESEDGKKGFLVEASGEIAEDLMVVRDNLIGKRVTAWGTIENRSITGKPGVTYKALVLSKLTGPEGIVLPTITDAPSLPAFDESEFDAAMAAVPVLP